MSSLTLAIGLAALIASSSVQAAGNEIVWSSVSFVLHGDRTPNKISSTPILTPAGAQQLYRQGSMFRARYLDLNNYTKGENAVTAHAPINGLEADAIDNSKLSIYSNTEPHVSASALAFMQGLYPPNTQLGANGTDGEDIIQLTNGSTVDYPLNGYQYPNVRVTSTQDPESIWIQGHVSCTQYRASSLSLGSDSVGATEDDNTGVFYQELYTNFFSKFQGFSLERVNFLNAYDLWDFAAYQYNHNITTHGMISAFQLAFLEELAWTQQQDLNGNLSSSGLQEGDMIRAISGRTLATRIVSLLTTNVGTTGRLNKLNLLFGSFEPFIAFFALSRLVGGASAEVFKAMPSPGAAMLFEMYSVGNNASVYPSKDDLWVRFLYRNGADPSTPFIEYSLFGNGVSQSRMRFADFVSSMNGIGIGSLVNWCNMCQSTQLFCFGLRQTGPGSCSSQGATSSSGQISPAVSGVIGAVLATCVFGLALVARRFYRGGKNARSSTLGGFKGAEKMASDTDLAYAKGGARHERTGSWELRGGGTNDGSALKGVEEGILTVPAATVVTTTRAFSSSKRFDDDAISELGHRIEPREGL